MKNLKRINIQKIIAVFFILFAVSANAQTESWDPELEEKAEHAISEMTIKNVYIESYMEESYAYAVYPSIGKGAIVIGGAHGRGLVYQKGNIVGETKMTQVSIGFQWGGQAYSEIIFFKDEAAFISFKRNELEFSGQMSAVAIKTGVSADIAYENGVGVFTMTKAGLMYEASLGGQKFKYFPLDSEKL